MLRTTVRLEAGVMFERLSGEPIYNTSAVARRTGVPADTFRAWERRYDIPRPGRTSGNQRLYAERDIATISWLREQTASGMTISQAIALFRLQQQAAMEQETAFPRLSGAASMPIEMRSAADRLIAALCSLDGSLASGFR